MLIKLSYRELGARLGLTADAARMKAKRESAKGNWRIIPGNHPQDKVYVELPQDAVPPEPVTDDGDAAPVPKKAPESGGPALEIAMGMVADAHKRIEALTDQLVAAKDDLVAAGEEGRKLAEELAAANAREAALAEEIERMTERARELEERITQSMETARRWRWTNRRS